jgi:polysaccharide deacetylase family sporulation protein PdaB
MILILAVGRRRLHLLLGIILVVLIILFAPPLALNLTEKAIEAVTGSSRLVPIYYVETPEKKVAFSFDASWGAERTPKILDILDKNGIKTTFFLTGIWVEDYPEMVREIHNRGHELGNHTLTHADLAKIPADDIRRELLGVEEMIKENCGQETTLMRPPFGSYNNQVISVAAELGYKTIQWSIDSLDWKEIGPQEIISRVTKNAHNGAIILFHNNGKHTADVLQEIIDYYHAEGYEIVPISELIYHENYYISPHSGAQIRQD